MTRPAVVARTLFWLALVVAVTMAVLPHPPHTPLDRFGDKVEHMTAFAVMSVLAAIGYSQARLPRIAERLSFLGALIEVAQSIPALHRDCDILDWVADTAAIAVTLLIVAAVHRARARPAT